MLLIETPEQTWIPCAAAIVLLMDVRLGGLFFQHRKDVQNHAPLQFVQMRHKPYSPEDDRNRTFSARRKRVSLHQRDLRGKMVGVMEHLIEATESNALTGFEGWDGQGFAPAHLFCPERLKWAVRVVYLRLPNVPSEAIEPAKSWAKVQIRNRPPFH